MKKTISSVILSAAIAASFVTTPVHAAVAISQVHTNVKTAIRKIDRVIEENTEIKQKVENVSGGVEMARHTANATIDEVIGLRSVLDPVFKIKTQFDQIGIDPNELLEDVPMEEFKKMIDEMKARKMARQAMLTENVEPFRAEFLELLESLNTIIRDEDAAIQVTPIQSLVENAPPPVIAMLRLIMSPIFEQLQARVASASGHLQYLRELGVFDAKDLALPGALNSSREEKLCTLAAKAKPVEFAVWQFNWQVDEIKFLIAATRDKLEDGAKNTEYELQIHGWLKFLSFNPFDGIIGSLDEIEMQVEKKQMRINHVGELAERAREWGSCEAVMDAASQY